jgi:hypothetical protein
MRVTTLIAASGAVAGVAVSLWDAAQAPADWVNYFPAASLVLALLALWLGLRWARTRRTLGHNKAGTFRLNVIGGCHRAIALMPQAGFLAPGIPGDRGYLVVNGAHCYGPK